jgi:hypothetical protein
MDKERREGPKGPGRYEEWISVQLEWKIMLARGSPSSESSEDFLGMALSMVALSLQMKKSTLRRLFTTQTARMSRNQHFQRSGFVVPL